MKNFAYPRVSLGTSRFGGRGDEIRKLLDPGVPKSAVANITGICRPTLHTFMNSP